MEKIYCKHTFQGALILSTWVNGLYVDMQYMGYTKIEALKKFRLYVKSVKGE